MALPTGIAQQRLYEIPQLEDALRTASLAACADAGLDDRASGLSVLSLPPHRRGATTVLPIRWLDARGDSDAIPPLDANIEMGGAPDGNAVLAILASCQLPGKERVVAKALLNQVAQLVLAGYVHGTWMTRPDGR